MKNVLVFPCGSEVGLEIHNALRFIKDINLIGGSSVEDHGKYVYKNYVGDIPFINSEDFLEKLQAIIVEHKIDFIFPAMDSVALILMKNDSQLDATIIASPYETCKICSSKRETYQSFSGADFLPKTYDSLEEVDEYPVFVKPDVGYGSRGARMASSKEELIQALDSKESMVICEYLPNEEFTVDCYTDASGNLLYVGPRIRRRVKGGISVNSQGVTLTPEIKRIANIINEKLEFKGPWFFQLKKDQSNNLKLMEIATRIAGTMVCSRVKGCNFSLLAIYDFDGCEVEVKTNEIDIVVDRALMNKYDLNYDYDVIYIDFDDTITNNKVVNPYAMMFLYQSLNQGKKIVLITRHSKDIYHTLSELHIDHSIFTKILWIKDKSPKSKYIEEKDRAIFIDDAFIERNDVMIHCGIPCFDIDALEALIDWKM